jgi:aminoglycoside phosphotransferase (APT) family kinase protein
VDICAICVLFVIFLGYLVSNAKFEQLAQKITPQGKLLRTWPLQGGISAQMTALELLLPDDTTQKMIVRQPSARKLQQNPQAAADEFKLLQITQAAGIATPTPYYLDQASDQSQQIFSTPCLVMDYIEGQPDFIPTNLANFILQFATQLAKIHSIDSSKLDLAFLPNQAKALANNLGKRPAKVDHSLDEGQIRDALEANWLSVWRRPSVLLHGDFWPGNVLWREGQLVGVIDWEDAKLGDPLCDLAISRLDMLWIFGRQAMQEFTQHYQSLMSQSRMASDFTNLPYWDLNAALRPASDIAEWATVYPPLGRADITEETMRAGHKWFITQAFKALAV